jgi:hypothetical protein
MQPRKRFGHRRWQRAGRSLTPPPLRAERRAGKGGSLPAKQSFPPALASMRCPACGLLLRPRVRPPRPTLARRHRPFPPLSQDRWVSATAQAWFTGNGCVPTGCPPSRMPLPPRVPVWGWCVSRETIALPRVRAHALAAVLSFHGPPLPTPPTAVRFSHGVAQTARGLHVTAYLCLLMTCAAIAPARRWALVVREHVGAPRGCATRVYHNRPWPFGTQSPPNAMDAPRCTLSATIA